MDNGELIEMLCCAAEDQSCPPEIQFSFNWRVFRARCEPKAFNGITYLGLSMQDVTQLIHLNRARRDMVANISHELRTPISTIRLLHDTINRPGAGKRMRKSVLRKIGRQLDALQRIVDDMHDLSMIESGQAIMRLVATPLAPLIDEVLEYLEEKIERRKIDITTEVPIGLFVLADGPQIVRVLINLIDNAIKFTPKHGDIIIQAETDPDDSEGVLVRVCDSGPGVPLEDRARIFERFYQRDQARSMGRGSGLGLSIVKHIIEAHNGHVWADDSPLGGACFCFTILNADVLSAPSTPEPDEE
jgi:two-component system phosphate regulon sensor histidine kinase PhoR